MADNIDNNSETTIQPLEERSEEVKSEDREVTKEEEMDRLYAQYSQLLQSFQQAVDRLESNVKEETKLLKDQRGQPLKEVPSQNTLEATRSLQEAIARLEMEIREEERILNSYERLEKKYYNLFSKYNNLAGTQFGRYTLAYWAFLKNKDVKPYFMPRYRPKKVKKKKEAISRRMSIWLFAPMDEAMMRRIEKEYPEDYKISDPNPDIRGVQMKSLELLKFFQDFCKKKDLTFFIVAGTLLGAVRHEGFIPWDDDIDVAMPRQDYDRFMATIGDELKNTPYRLRDISTMPTWVGMYSSLVDSRTTIIAYDRRFDRKAIQGAFMDIFPVDNAPDGQVLREQQLSELNKWFDRMVFKRYGFKNRRSLRTSRWDRLMARVLPGKMIWNKYREECTKYNGTVTKDIVFNGFPDFAKYVYDKDWFYPLRPYLFESVEFPGPQDFEAYLKYFYGNYMKMPPEENRRAHGYFFDADHPPSEVWDFQRGEPKSKEN
jgi:lipopolysaccharide cholinephosphotransferase